MATMVRGRPLQFRLALLHRFPECWFLALAHLYGFHCRKGALIQIQRLALINEVDFSIITAPQHGGQMTSTSCPYRRNRP
jgi:hypothetical protein